MWGGAGGDWFREDALARQLGSETKGERGRRKKMVGLQLQRAREGRVAFGRGEPSTVNLLGKKSLEG